MDINYLARQCNKPTILYNSFTLTLEELNIDSPFYQRMFADIDPFFYPITVQNILTDLFLAHYNVHVETFPHESPYLY